MSGGMDLDSTSGGSPPNYHGLSLCCYAPLIPTSHPSSSEYFTCTECATLFNNVSQFISKVCALLIARSDDTEARD